MNKLTTIFWKIYQGEENKIQGVAGKLPDFISPNLLSWLRLILLVPIILTIQNNQYLLAALLFLIAYFLDVLDGALARVKKRITKFGTLFDPLVDKINFLAVLFLLALNRLPPFLIYLMFSLELLIILLVMITKPLSLILKLEVKMGANIFGKIKMFFQILGITILFILIITNHPTMPATVIFIIATFFNILSILAHLLSVHKVETLS